jgi:hypothetical protein
MNDLTGFKTSYDMNYGVDFANVGKELVSQTLAFACPFDKTRYVDKVDRCMNDPAAFENFREVIKPPVRYADRSDIGVDGAKRSVFRRSIGACERIEQSAFPDVGKSYDTYFHLPSFLCY